MSPSARAETRIPSRSDMVAIWGFMIAGVAIVAWAIVNATMRTIEILGNCDVHVPAEFAGTSADAPIGPDGAIEVVALDRAILTVPELPVASVAAGVLEQVAFAGTIAIVVTCLVLLSRSILQGQLFSRRNTRLAATAGIVGLVGAAAMPFFGNMVANGGFARISDGTFDNVVIAIDLLPYLLGAFVVAIICTAFTVGERLQRDTEGLV